MQHIVSNIKSFRKARGMTQEDMAKKLGVTRSAYANIEQGTRGSNNLNTLINVYKALGIKLTLIYECEPTSLGLKYEVGEHECES